MAFTQDILRQRALDQVMAAMLELRQIETGMAVSAALKGAVCSGPFAGMKMPEASSWGSGDIAPKLLGSYENELHPEIEIAILRNPDVVINVGCAEGYYAVGLARRLPDAVIHAFDPLPQARATCFVAATENDVSDRLKLYDECDAGILARIAGEARHALVVMDCEGAELGLLHESMIPRYRAADLIIECHDYLDATITPKLWKRFMDSHQQFVIEEKMRLLGEIPAPLKDMCTLDRLLSLYELRPAPMHWLALRSP